MAKIARSRRRFLTAIALLGGLGALWRFLVPGRKVRRQTLLEVQKNTIPLRGALVFKRSRVAVIRGEDDVYALSLVCTHLGCTVNVTAENLICPCHGSVFDRAGNVIKGPAERPLPRLTVEERGNKLVVLI